ncbi:MAG: hypothetical protein COA58_01330 [Bacteroidetes bacterium]|nr:MAG: hypothetical protein COA58_01330 [Bacteroidota bacterium]
MELLRNIPIGIDQNNDGIEFNLNLYSEGSKANYLDDFPMEIVRSTGARFEIVNNAFKFLNIKDILLGIVLNNQIHKAYSSSYFMTADSQKTLKRGASFEIAFEGKELVDILDNFQNEKGVMIVNSAEGYILSNLFDGDFVEQQLDSLNNDTNPEYQNWKIKDFASLDLELTYGQLDYSLKKIVFD